MSDKLGLPELPFTGNLTGTHWELSQVEKHYQIKWDPSKDMGGLTDRHRQEVLRYIGRMTKYALAIGIKPEHIEESVKIAFKFPEYP